MTPLQIQCIISFFERRKNIALEHPSESLHLLSWGEVENTEQSLFVWSRLHRPNQKTQATKKHQPQPSSSWPMQSSSQSWPTPWSDHHHPKPSCSPLFSVHHLPQHQVGAKHLWASPSTTRPGEQLVNMRASPILANFLLADFHFLNLTISTQ